LESITNTPPGPITKSVSGGCAASRAGDVGDPRTYGGGAADIRSDNGPNSGPLDGVAA
jgi:hypothetical protein